MPNIPYTFYNLADKARGDLLAEISAAAVSLSVTSGQGIKFPASDFVVKIDNEAVYVGSRSTDAFSSLTRGYNGTTAAVHLINAPVFQSADRALFQRLYDNINGHTHQKADIPDFSHTHTQGDITNLTTDMSLKAALASPTFTGSVNVSGIVRFSGPDPYVDVTATNLTRLCSRSTTTTTGTISSGSNSLSVTAIADFLVRHGVSVLLDSGGVFRSYITNIVGTTVTLNDNAPSAASSKQVEHDDTLAIQDAIDSCAALGGKVFGPVGVYNIWQLKLKTSVTLAGNGTGSILAALDGNNSTGMIILNAATVSRISIMDIRIDGSRFTGSPAPTCPLILLDNTGQAPQPHQLTRVHLTNGGADGLKLVGCQTGHKFTDVHIYLCAGHGLTTDATTFFQQFSNLTVDGSGLHGIYELGAANMYASTRVSQSGQVDAVNFGDGWYFGAASHGHNIQAYSTDNLRHGMHWETGVGWGKMTVVASVHSNEKDHLRFTSGDEMNIRATIIGAPRLTADSVLNMIGGFRNDIHVTYNTAAFTANAAPAIGAALAANDNYIVLRNGSRFSSGHWNIFECEPLIVTPGYLEGADSVLWEHTKSLLYELPG